MGKQKREEEMKDMRAQKTTDSFVFDASTNFDDKKIEELEMSENSTTQKVKDSIEKKVESFVKNDEKKLIDSVAKMKQQREDEMSKIKASKAADSSIINASNYGEKDNTQELDNDTSKKNKKPKKKNSLLFLAKNDEKKLMDSVSKIKEKGRK